MAAEILSQDIIAICLVLSEGNLTMSLGELIERVEQYQERQDRHFGLSRQDFRGLFRNWLCDLGLAKLDDFSPLAPRCPIPLQRLLSRILEFHSAWFNDEGEYWNQEPSWGTRAVIGLGYGGGGAPPPRSGPWGAGAAVLDEEKLRNIALKHRLQRLLNPGDPPQCPGAIDPSILQRLGITEAILQRCGRPGASS